MNLIIALVVLFIIYNLYLSRYEYFNNNKPYFMSREETISFFKNDRDNYVKTMTELDIKALKSTSKEDYLNKSISDADDFTNEEKRILTRACGEADDFFREFDKIPNINFKKIADMKWVLSKTEGNWYEGGYPHTREDVIFITPDVIHHYEIARIMVHEKIHVFERLYPKEMKVWMDAEGYVPYKLFRDYPMGRSNPDLDGIVYLDKNGNETIVQFTTTDPKSIDDRVTYPGNKDWKEEHPNETLAYRVDYYYAGEPIDF
jgi:hypothetical protein